MNNYLIEGNDYIALDNKIKSIINESNFSDVLINYYDLSNSLLDSVLEDLDTYGFISEKKVIVVKNFDKLKLEENQTDIEHLVRYLDSPSPDNLLILVASKLDDRKKITKELKKRLNCLKDNLDPEDFIKNELKDYKIESGVVSKLVDMCSSDITKIFNECSKLKDYKLDEKIINLKDLDDIVVEKTKDCTDITFSFVRAIALKDVKEALKLYNTLLEYKVEPIGVIGLLASQFRIMYQVKVLDEKRISDNEIGDILSEKPYRVKKTRELIKYYSKEEILNLLIKLSNMDLDIKTKSSDANLLIQLFIINM